VEGLKRIGEEGGGMMKRVSLNERNFYVTYNIKCVICKFYLSYG